MTENLSRITAGSLMVGTPINIVSRLLIPGLIKDPILPLLLVDVYGEKAGKKGGAARSRTQGLKQLTIC